MWIEEEKEREKGVSEVGGRVFFFFYFNFFPPPSFVAPSSPPPPPPPPRVQRPSPETEFREKN